MKNSDSHDELITQISDFVHHGKVDSELAKKTALWCFQDSIACALQALKFPACTEKLGALSKGTRIEKGVKVWGTDIELEPIKGAWDIGCIIRWLDYNDTWLAAEWGHPSDNLGGIWVACDYANQHLNKKYTLGNVLEFMIKAYEIQGVLSLNHSFNKVGIDHVFLVKLASTAVCSYILGCNKEQTKDAISHVFADGGTLRAYRHTPNTMSRKSWAAGDATSRAIFFSLLTIRGEKGMETVLSTKKWGFEDVIFKGKKIRLGQKLGSYVMENILFKVSFPAEFHAQTAIEAAIIAHRKIGNKLLNIKKIEIFTHEAAIRIISKSGKLNNSADRDHCLQYMVACGLLFGNISAEYYENSFASLHPKIDKLREKMVISERKSYTKDYFDPEKRAIPNAIRITFLDNTSIQEIEIYYPIGHKRRRKEGIPALLDKFTKSVNAHYPKHQANEILHTFNSITEISEKKVEEISYMLSTLNS